MTKPLKYRNKNGGGMQYGENDYRNESMDENKEHSELLLREKQKNVLPI